MSTVSTKEIAPIPQEVEQETKDIISYTDGREYFSRRKAGLVSILLATVPCVDKAPLLTVAWQPAERAFW